MVSLYLLLNFLLECTFIEEKYPGPLSIKNLQNSLSRWLGKVGTRCSRRTNLVCFQSDASSPEALETFPNKRNWNIAKFYDMVMALDEAFGLFLLKYYAEIQSFSKNPGGRKKQPQEGQLKIKKEKCSGKN